jgi:hypothetical protein
VVCTALAQIEGVARLVGRSSRASQSGLGPRTWLAGRRARSTSAVAVKANSTEAEPRISPCWVGRRSLHRFFEAMIKVTQNNRSGGTPDWAADVCTTAVERVGWPGVEAYVVRHRRQDGLLQGDSLTCSVVS